MLIAIIVIKIKVSVKGSAIKKNKITPPPKKNQFLISTHSEQNETSEFIKIYTFCHHHFSSPRQLRKFKRKDQWAESKGPK